MPRLSRHPTVPRMRPVARIHDGSMIYLASNVPSRQSPDFAQRTPARVALLGPARSIHTIRWANGLALRGLQVHLLSLETPGSLAVRRGRIVQYRLLARSAGVTSWRAPRLRALLKTHRPGSAQRSLCDRLRPVGAPRPFLPVLLSAWGSDIYEFPNSSTWHKALLRAISTMRRPWRPPATPCSAKCAA